MRISDWSSDVCSSDLGAAPCPASICTPRSGVPGSTSRLSPWRLESGRSASSDQCEALRAWPLDRLSARVVCAAATLDHAPPTLLNGEVAGNEGYGIVQFLLRRTTGSDHAVAVPKAPAH